MGPAGDGGPAGGTGIRVYGHISHTVLQPCQLGVTGRNWSLPAAAISPVSPYEVCALAYLLTDMNSNRLLYCTCIEGYRYSPMC